MITRGELAQQWPRLKYLMVGAFCALLNLIIQNTAVLVFGAHYVVAILLSFVTLVPLSFFIHKKFTFETSTSLSFKRFLMYTVQWGVLLVFNILLLALFVDVLHVHVSLSILLVAIILHIPSYLFSRGRVFSAETPAK
jgi:putative flippase GtrA